MNIPFSPPYIDQDIINEVNDSLNSGWITTGPKVKALEEEIKKYTKAPQALCVNSWTSGAILAMKWFGIGPGDEVIVPVYTYSATALAVIHCGATPVIVDVKEDFNIDPEEVIKAITPKTKVIIPVDFGGWPCNYDKIFKIIEEKKGLFKPTSQMQEKLGRILILADTAHSLGAIYHNQPSGSLADISVFSFHAVKNVTTAEGGAICLALPPPFDNAEVYETLRLWTLNGQTKDAFTKSQGGEWKYDIVYPGFKMNMPDLCAAVGLAQIKIYKDKLLPKRKRIFQQYLDFFRNENWAICPVSKMDGSESSYHIFALRLIQENEKLRDQIIAEAAKRGVSLNVHFIPLTELTVFKNMGYQSQLYPKAMSLYKREISLPVYPTLSEEECDYVCQTIKEIALREIA